MTVGRIAELLPKDCLDLAEAIALEARDPGQWANLVAIRTTRLVAPDMTAPTLAASRLPQLERDALPMRREDEARASILLAQLAEARAATLGAEHPAALEALGSWAQALIASARSERRVDEILEEGTRPLSAAAVGAKLPAEQRRSALMSRVYATWTAGALDHHSLDSLLADSDAPEAPFARLLDAERHAAADGWSRYDKKVSAIVQGLRRGAWRGRWAGEAAAQIASRLNELEGWELARELNELALEVLGPVESHDQALVAIHAALSRALTAIALRRDASTELDAALALVDAHVGPTHIWRAYALADHGKHLCGLERYREAYRPIKRAADLVTLHFSDVPIPPRLADVRELAAQLRRFA